MRYQCIAVIFTSQDIESWPFSPRVSKEIKSSYYRMLNFCAHTTTEIKSTIGVVYFITMTVFILLSVFNFCEASLLQNRIRASKNEINPRFHEVEYLCVIVFSFDYLIRFLSNPGKFENWKAIKSTTNKFLMQVKIQLKFIFHPLNLIDLGSIVPFYVALKYPNANSFSIFRVLRLIRLLRLFETLKHFKVAKILLNVVADAFPSLLFLLYAIALLIVAFANIVFLCEEGTFNPTLNYYERPDVTGYGTEISPFESIPHSIWYTIVTITTVGYGDLYPTSTLGRVAGSLVALFGILSFSLPITVISNSYNKQIELLKTKTCAKKMAKEQAKKAREVSSEADVDAIDKAKESPAELAPTLEAILR